jgi:hypothetical protein
VPVQLRAAAVGNVIQLQIGGALDLYLHAPPPEPRAFLTVQFGSFKATAEGPMAVTLPVGNMINVQVEYTDTAGNPATVDGDVSWASSNDTIATVAADGTDSTKCKVSATGLVGDAQITATADADLGSGTRELVTFLDVHVIAGEAVAGTINVVGAVEPIP